MSEPNWTSILEYLYKNEKIIEYKNSEPIKDLEILDDVDCINKDNFSETMGYMRDLDLVEYSTEAIDGDTIKRFSLTETGLKVAHDREQKRESQQINDSIRNLTLILAIAALIQAISAVATVDRPEVFVILGGSFVLLIMGVLILHYGLY